MTDLATTHEPDEREDPRNALLDMMETVAEQHDLAAPLFHRLKAKLPASSDQAPVAAGGIEREMALTTVLTALRTIEKFRKSQEHATLIETAKKIVADELAAARGARQAPSQEGGNAK